MKKYLFLASVAALSFTACTNETEEYVGAGSANQQKEIALFALNQKATKAAITDGVFPTAGTIEVAAYTGGKGELFSHSTFTWSSSGTIWTGGKYWPLSPCFVNFLAYAYLTPGASAPTWGTTSNTDASKVVLPMGDNSSAQNDLMYAVGQGQVSQTDNALTFPENVGMAFKHAQALLTFNLKAADAASQAITITSISLKNAHFAGTYTIDNSANYDATSVIVPSVTGSWTTVGDAKASQEVAVSGALSETRTGQIMAVPNGVSAAFDKFVINYQLNSVDYSYEYTPSDRALAEGKNYVYDITFKLNEIKINASVNEWTDNRTEYINIPTMAIGSNYTVNASKYAQTLTFNIAGLTDDKYIKVTKGGTDVAQLGDITPAAGTQIDGTSQEITAALNANTTSNKTMTLTIQQYDEAGCENAYGDPTVITITQAY